MRNNYDELIARLREKQGNSKPYRVLALDLGVKIIGLAIYDSRINISLPFGHIKSDGKSMSNFEKIIRISSIVNSESLDTVVIGLPLEKSGAIGDISRSILEFAEKLAETLDISVVTYDERFSSRLADRMLRDLGHLNRKKRNILDNEVAATIILNDFIQLISKKLGVIT